METQQVQQVRKIADMLFRRKGLICLSVILGLAGGLGFYLMQPKLYQSSALVSYQQQRVNPARMSPDTEANVRDMVTTLTQIITSRSNLEQIINREKLYSDLSAVLPMTDIVSIMRKNINIVVPRAGQGDAFQVSYSSGEREKVAKVTNALAAGFIDENMKFREEKASETSVYTEDELHMAKEMLDTLEESMRDYKLKHYNEMPEQQANNVSRLIALQTQYQNTQASIQDLERTRLLLQEQITVRKQLVENAIAQTVAAGQTALMETDRQRLNRFQAELQAMLLRYTDQHPSVRALQRRIDQLETKISQEAALGGTEGSEGRGSRTDDELFDLELQVKGIGLNIAKLNKEKDAIQKLIGQYEEMVTKAPMREAEWSSLSREYAETRRHYDFLVSQNLQARSALNLEVNQKGSQFKIQDLAMDPVNPVSPNFIRIMLFALVAGSGLGGALVFILEMLNTSFRYPRDCEESIKKQFGMDMICAVPHLSLKREIIKERVLFGLGSSTILALATGLTGVFVYFYRSGQIIL